ncbi:MAG: glycosyltransferase family 9 protein [Terricaulis sp.]
MAQVLFLVPDDLGEAVLATGALAYALRDGGDVSIVTTADAAPLFRAVPGRIETRLIGKGVLDPAATWAGLAGKRFQVLLDGRAGLLGSTLSAAQRIALQPGPVIRHRVEDWAAAFGADHSLAPTLALDAAARDAAATKAPGEGVMLVLAPGGASAAKRWPADRFAAVARRLCDGELAAARVVVLGAAARDADITRGIVSSLDADGIAAIDLGRGIDLLGAAALLERATLCIGNDNALTHIAAAMGAPTLTLFGPTDERVRAPYGARARTLRGRSFEEAATAADLDAGAAMADVSIDAVEAAALDLLHAGGLR